MEQSVLSATMASATGRVRSPVNVTKEQYLANMPKLTRGFSKVQANQEFVNETRNQIENSYKNLNQLNEMNYLNKFLNNELTCYSFMLPDLNHFEDYKFKEYLQNDLIEMPTQYNLTESGHLNWWTEKQWENVCRPLYPMITSGDGNCLLHAASLAMWGLHDRYLILRKALNSTLKQIKEDNSSPLWRRWKWEQMCQNRKYGLIYDEDEWAKEWQSLLKLSSYQPRVANSNQTTSSKQSSSIYPHDTDSHNASSSSVSASSLRSASHPHTSASNQDNSTCYFESLEEFHVFLLANILQRPIIIVSDTMLHDLNGEPLSPIPFGGIYLPFECELSRCHRYPLVLAYDSAHFSALVLMDEEETDSYENDQENNYQETDSDTILSNDEINQINKKLQLRPPYSIIPIQYANKDLLPIHFAYDPGEDYDWSRFPMHSVNTLKQTNQSPTAATAESSTIKKSSNSSSSSNNSSNDNMSVSSTQNNNPGSNYNSSSNSNSTEMSRSEKMFIIQKYLDICKLELYDPGPLSTKRSNQVFNSNGMCANIHNIQVPEPFPLGDGSKALKSPKSTGKLQKFFANLFKKNSSDSTSPKSPKLSETAAEKTSPFSSKLRKSLRNSYSPSPSLSSNSAAKSTLTSISTNQQVFTAPKIKVTQSSPTPHTASALMPQCTNTSTVFHKVQPFKNWNSLFHALANNSNSFLGVKLNLAKPPKFKQVINNYIDSAKLRLEIIRQQHRAQMVQQQHQHQIYLQQQRQQQIPQNRQELSVAPTQYMSDSRKMPNTNERMQEGLAENNHVLQQCSNCSSQDMCQRCYALRRQSNKPNTNNGRYFDVSNMQQARKSIQYVYEDEEDYDIVQHL